MSDTPNLRVISLGGGVQSSTMLMMSNRGLLAGGVKPDAAIFADTGNEPEAVYTMVEWLTANSETPVHTVRYKTPITEALSSRDNKAAHIMNIPWYTTRKDDGSTGMNRRACTNRWKIQPIEQQIRRLLGVKRVTSNSGISVEQWLGISVDEIERVSAPRTPWMTNLYPLIDAGLTRSDCHAWWDKNIGDSAPPLARSACIICPFHTNTEWLEILESEPDKFAEACELEATFNRLQEEDGYDNVKRYMHRRRIPLAEAVAAEKHKRDSQPVLFERAGECSGNCWT